MLSDKILDRLLTVQGTQNDIWYITKQDCNFSHLCYIANILELWNNDSAENYQFYFDRVKLLEPFARYLQANVAHRATINCSYYGLLRQQVGRGNYNPSDLTPVYYYIKSLCDGNFADTSKYQHIIDNQLEKIAITNNKFAIKPIMFTLKVLLLIGDATGKYSISIEEFKIFVATAQKYSEYFAVVESILRFRNDEEFRQKCLVSKENVGETRYNLVVKNHSFFDKSSNEVSLIPDKIKETRRRVAEYELKETIDADINNNELYDVTVIRTEQIIYFGAPGTGKSFKVEHREGETEDDRIRTTFHPDTDYSSFVGCYKPMQDEDDPKRIIYKFEGQCFTKAYIEAWKRFVNRQEGQNINFTLIIEEINRGNCAQIFGDIFQLLDRNGDGFSQYTISPDIDLTNFLAEEFEKVKEVKEQMTEQGFEKIADGTEMKLPPNLSIIATMNTSDQSLFPIDSAFKRRWDWEYIPISYSPKDKDLTPIKNKIDINGTIYDWGEFIKVVNERILKLTHSEDKQLGYFFVKPVEGDTITLQRFVSKVIFYLWSDIYKDYAGRNDSIFKVDGEDISFNRFFVDGDIDDDLVNKFIQQLGVEPLERIDEVSIESPKPYFRVNNSRCNSSARLAATIVKEFVNLNKNLSADEVIQQWSVINVPSNKTFISKTQGGGTWDRIACANGTFLYVSRENWYFNTGKNEANVIALIKQVNEQNWGIEVEIIQS